MSRPISVNLLTPHAAIETILARLKTGRGFTLFTLNLDHLVKLRSDPAFRSCYASADLVTADGWPIVWALGRRGVAAERTTGADLVAPLCEAAAREGHGVFFIGPQPDVQTQALAVLQARYAGLRIAGTDASVISPKDDRALDDLARRIDASGARLCFVCLGAPKQEFVAAALRIRCPGVGFLCVGAALDFIAGAVRRAPALVQSLKLEWAWRLLSDPARLGPRYAQCALMFAQLAVNASPQFGGPQARDAASTGN